MQSFFTWLPDYLQHICQDLDGVSWERVLEVVKLDLGTSETASLEALSEEALLTAFVLAAKALIDT